jgi:ATP-dependent RNA helicase MSS116
MAKQTFLAAAKFSSLPLHQDLQRALRDEFGYVAMSAPQALYLPVALAGGNLLVRAATGTGKTAGYLLPALQRILTNTDGTGRKSAGRTPPGIGCLILSPSRELAAQIAAEAGRLLRFRPQVQVRLATGGHGVGAERAALAQRVDLLVATPGRLQDHLTNLANFRQRLAKVSTLVLDEADRLLDMGFQKAILDVAAGLDSSTTRQVLLFTATVPPGVLDVARRLLSPGAPPFAYVDTGRNQGNQNSSRRSASRRGASTIHQESLVVPTASWVTALYRVVLSHRRGVPRHKLIVFTSTARMAELLAALFRAAGMTDAMELHSRLKQSQRDRTTALLSAPAGTTGTLLFASDVVARGVDFPDVTLVVQMGLTDVQQYEHRVGRTGRAGKSGDALIMLCEDEAAGLLARLRAAGFPLEPSPPGSVLAAGLVSNNTGNSSTAGSETGPMRAVIDRLATDSRLEAMARSTYTSTLGFYKSHLRTLKWTREQLFQGVGRRLAAVGLTTPPTLDDRMLRKMGLA